MMPEDNLVSGRARRMRFAILIAIVLVSLRMAGVAAHSVKDADAGGVPTPPATYYGQVLAGPGFAPAAGMSVNAWVDDHLCGQSVTMDQQGEIVYTVNVVGEGPGGIDGCGALGRVVVFQVAARFMAPTPVWDNSQLHELPLQPMHPPRAPQVSIERDGESLVLSWDAVVLDTAGLATLVTSYRIWRGLGPYFDPPEAGCDCIQIAEVSDLTYTDSDGGGTNVVSDVNHNYTYVVKAVNAADESGSSNRVGEFDFALVPGSQ